MLGLDEVVGGRLIVTEDVMVLGDPVEDEAEDEEVEDVVGGC